MYCRAGAQAFDQIVLLNGNHKLQKPRKRLNSSALRGSNTVPIQVSRAPYLRFPHRSPKEAITSVQLTKWLKGLTRKSMLAAALATLLLAPLAPIAAAESATAIPHLDRARFLGSWFQIAAIPTKTQKVCLRNTRTEYALADGANSFQTGTFCRLKSNNGDWESNGRFDKHDSGRLKLIRLWPFTSKYWVLATAPDYAWDACWNTEPQIALDSFKDPRSRSRTANRYPRASHAAGL